jgi:hypothetical protein
MASQLGAGRTQFLDANGTPLVGGTVTFYIPGTTVLTNTWQDRALTTLNTNPVVLDGLGSAVIWGSGTYRQVVHDVAGNLLWDQLVTDVTQVGAFTNSASNPLIVSLFGGL